jgi:hypothetical protein
MFVVNSHNLFPPSELQTNEKRFWLGTKELGNHLPMQLSGKIAALQSAAKNCCHHLTVFVQ